MSRTNDPSAADPRVARAVEEYEAELRAGRAPDRAAFLARHREIAAELAECLDGLEFIRTAAPRTDADDRADVQLPNPLGDFRVAREVGRGGMGVVYEAEQLSLGRRVALKVLPFAAALDPRRLQRFRNEALAAAQLHHPHIVPVHAVGCERGVHFYAMQFVEGQTLDGLIGNLRAEADGRRPESAGGTEAWPPLPPRPETPAGAASPTARSPRSAGFVRAAAGLAADAADALEYAHQMGVVHRDVKPANLMVDARGHLWVTDFGLALFRNDPGPTATGDLVGTLRYMAPEQAGAKHDLVDHRADVYALGLTLYELLTLRPAFDGRDRREVLRRVLTDDPPPPRRLNRAVPPDLETVVLKATAKEPAARYATAQDFADDLRRFLDDRPIAARRPGPVAVAAKWARRHRTLVATAVAALAVTAAGLAGSLAYVAAEREDTARQRDFARRAVDDMYTDVAERWLDQEPHMEGVQREFLRKALEYYQEFARDEGRDPKIRFAAATAHRRVGDIHQKLEEGANAEAAYAGAIHRFDRLAADYPDREEYREALGHCHQNLAGMLARDKRHADAEAAYLRAIALRERLGDVDETPSKHRFDLAVSLAGYGQLLQAGGRMPEAGRAYNRARELLTGLTKTRPDPATHNQLGVVLGGLAELPGGDRWQTRELLDKAAWHLKEALKTSPRNREGRDQLAAVQVHLARTLVRLGERKQAKNVYEDARELRERLAADFPRTAHHRRELAAIHTELGDLATAEREHKDASREYGRAIAVYGRLADEYPDSPGYARDLAWLLATCPAASLRDPGRAVTFARRATEQAPDGGDCWRALGAALCRSENWAEAVAALDKAVALRGGGGGAREWLLLALAHGKLGDRAQALRWYDKARGWEDPSAAGTADVEALRAEVKGVIAPGPDRDDGKKPTRGPGRANTW